MRTGGTQAKEETFTFNWKSVIEKNTEVCIIVLGRGLKWECF